MTASNILEQLKNEHEEVKALFKVAEDCEEYERSDVLKLIKLELVPHARGEEKTVYSLLKERLDDQRAPEKDITLANEAYEEHRVVDKLLKELEGIDVSDEKWAAHLKVLKENVEHHIKEEEEELFKLIKDHFSDDDLADLKAVYMTTKDRYSETLPSQSQIKERQPNSDAQFL